MRKQTNLSLIIFSIIIILAHTAFAEFVVIEDTAAESNILEKENTSSNFIVQTYSLLKDFSLSSTRKELSICSCSTLVDKITLQNTGNMEEVYTISSDKEYSRLSKNTVVLKPGESQEIINYITPECKEFNDKLKTIVTTTSGISKELAQDVEVKACNDIIAAISNKTLKTTPCVPVTSNFTLKNPQDYIEYYDFDTDLLRDNIYFKPATIKLLPNETKLIVFQYNTTCDLYGDYNGNIIVRAQKTQLEQSLPVSLSINRTYRFDVNAAPTAESCNFMTTRIPITIKNQERFENKFTLSLPQNLWFALENKTVVLGPNEQKTVYIISKPEWKEAGAQYLTYSVKSTYGNIEKTGQIYINIPDCNTFNAEKAMPDRICSEDQSYYFDLNNTGTKTNRFTVTIKSDALENGTTTKEVTMSSGQKARVQVPTNFKDKDYTARFKVEIGVQNHTLTESFKQKVAIKSSESCHKVRIDASDVEANTTVNQNNITITNIGLKDGAYNVALDSAPWASIIRKDVYIRKNTTETVFLRTSPGNITGDYKATLLVTEKNSNATYTKEFIITANPKTASQIMNEYYTSTKEFYTKNKDVIQATLIIVAMLFIIAGLIYLAVMTRKNILDKRRKLIVGKPRRR